MTCKISMNSFHSIIQLVNQFKIRDLGRDFAAVKREIENELRMEKWIIELKYEWLWKEF